MRKITSLFLVISLTVTLAAYGNKTVIGYTVTPLTQNLTVVYGDVDGDKKITAADALLTLQVVVNTVFLDRNGYRAADVSGELFSLGYMEHSANDALLILKRVVGKITRFPVEDLDPLAPPILPETKPDGQLTPGQEVDFVVDIPTGRNIKILQLNDLQPTYLEAGETTCFGHAGPFGTPMSHCVWPYVTEAINAAQPDLIVLGGDNVEGEFDENGNEWAELCEMMDSYQIPWVIIFGNHDRESNAGMTWQTAMIHQSEYGMFASADCTGDSNYTVAIRQGGEYKYLLYLLDTNGTNPATLIGHPQKDLICTKYGLQPDQLRWIKNTGYGIEYDLGRPIPSLMFMHIPPACANNAIDKYYPDYMELPFSPTNEGDFGTATETPGGGGGEELDTIAKEINCKGMFFAHQHQVAMSILYDGIRYTWGMKSSLGSYVDTNLIGSTLITIDEQTNDFRVDYLPSDLV